MMKISIKSRQSRKRNSLRNFLTLYRLFLRAVFTRFPIFLTILAGVSGLASMLIWYFRELDYPDVIVGFISNLDLPEFAIYGSARLLIRIINPLSNIMILGAMFVVLYSTSQRISRQEVTILCQPVRPITVSAARVLTTIVPLLIVRVILIGFGFLFYSYVLSSAAQEFVILFLPTIWAPILVCIVHDLFFYSMIFALGKLARYPVLGLVLATMIIFPSPLSIILLTDWSFSITGGILSSEFAVLFLFYSILQPSNHAYWAWHSELGYDFARSSLSSILAIWVVFSLIFIWLSIGITRRYGTLR